MEGVLISACMALAALLITSFTGFVLYAISSVVSDWFGEDVGAFFFVALLLFTLLTVGIYIDLYVR